MLLKNTAIKLHPLLLKFIFVVSISSFIFVNPVTANTEQYDEDEGSTATGIRQQIVDSALKYQGVPYVWGGASPSGFDSSGIIWFVFNENGIEIPRVSFDIYEAGTPISKSELLPGDLVFFEGYRPGPSHGVIYIGNGEFVHSPSAGSTVSVSSLDAPYYSERYYGAVRFIDSTNVRVLVNNDEIEFSDQKPFINDSNRTMVPVRFVSEELGAEVDWDPNKGDKGRVIIKKDDTLIHLSVGSSTYTINGESKEMDTATSILGSRTIVPLRFIIEALEAEIVWDSSERVVRIYYEGF